MRQLSLIAAAFALCAANTSSTPPLRYAPGFTAPLDIWPKNVAFACSPRALYAGYSGALLNLRESTGNTTQDFFPTSTGDFPNAAATTFANGANLFVTKCYDQSGYGNHLSNATAANQPKLVLSAVNSKACPQYTDGGATSLGAAASSASTLNIFSAGGTLVTAVSPSVPATSADRIAQKGNSGASGWVVFLSGTNINPDFQQGASTTSGNWITSIRATAAHIWDFQYNSSALSNKPTITEDGNLPLALTSTQPVGTINTDTAFALVLGSNAVTGGTKGFPGYICEIMGWSNGGPSANALEAIRKNAGTYYGITVK